MVTTIAPRQRILVPSVALLALGCLPFPAVAAGDVEWSQDAVWYQIFPERFRNGDRTNDPVRSSLQGTWPYEVPDDWQISPWGSDWYELQPWEARDGRGFYLNAQRRRYGGDLQGIIDQLDYLEQLGVNAIYLNPVFESPSLHKYGAALYHHVDKHFGPSPQRDLEIYGGEDPGDPATWQWTAADRLFLKLVNEVHRRKMHIIIDGVFNHVGTTFWALERARREGPGGRYANWFRVLKWDDPGTPADEFDYAGWAGIKDLPELARDAQNLHPDVRQHLHAAVRRWMDPNGDGDPSDGIDGWRLDVAAEVPLGFWEEFAGWCRTINPHAYLTGEIWWEDYAEHKLRDARPWLGRAFDGVMNYRFGDAALRFLNEPEGTAPSEFGRVLTTLHRDYGYDRCLRLQNLLDSHDTARLGSAVVNPRARMDHGASLSDYRDFDVRQPNASEKRRWKQLVAFQFLAPGAPYVYYGDEVGMWGADDPDCRKPMLWPDVEPAAERAHPFGASRQEDRVQIDSDLFGFYREWMARRHTLAVLRRGDFQVVLTDDPNGLFAFRRDLQGASVLAVFNASGKAARVTATQLGLVDARLWRDGPSPVAAEIVVEPHWFKFFESAARE